MYNFLLPVHDHTMVQVDFSNHLYTSRKCTLSTTGLHHIWKIMHHDHCMVELWLKLGATSRNQTPGWCNPGTIFQLSLYYRKQANFDCYKRGNWEWELISYRCIRALHQLRLQSKNMHGDYPWRSVFFVYLKIFVRKLWTDFCFLSKYITSL